MFKCHFNLLYGNITSVLISIILVFSCIYNCIVSPHFMCKLNKCNTIKSTVMISMFPRAVSMLCMLSKITVLYKNFASTFEYNKKIKTYELYYPVDVDKANFRMFVVVTVSLCVTLILPINLFRIYLLYRQFRDNAMVLFFSIMYIQNASMCVTELEFIASCFGLYQKYRSINEDMAVLESRTIVTNRYPPVLSSRKCYHIRDNSDFNNDFCKKTLECQLVYSIESLKMRHRFVSDSVSDLNGIYSIQLGLSLFILFLMTLFDIYEVVFTELNMYQMYWGLYVWLIQYAFRFCMIVLTTHVTTKQVIVNIDHSTQCC